MQAKQSQPSSQKLSNYPTSHYKMFFLLLLGILFYACDQESNSTDIQAMDEQTANSTDDNHPDHTETPDETRDETQQMTPLTESRILTTTLDQQLVVINPTNGEVQPFAYSGSVSHLSSPPITVGNRIGITLTETTNDENIHRFLILNQNLEILANHTAPSALNPCLNHMQKVVALDSNGDRFLVLCGQESKERTHMIIFGDELQVTPLPEQHNYIGLPLTSSGETLPLITRNAQQSTFNVINTLTGEITPTGEHNLWNYLPKTILPQDDEGLIYFANKVNVGSGEYVYHLHALDVQAGVIAYTIEGPQELIHSGGWHRESELLNGHVVLTTAEGVVVVDTNSHETFSAGDINWPIMSRVSPDGHYAFLAFPNKLERHDLVSGEIVVLEASADEPWYQMHGSCVYSVDTLNFSPTGDTALLSSKNNHIYGACPAIPELSFSDSPYSLVINTQDLENPIVLHDEGSLTPRYAPNGSALAYFRNSQDDCIQLHITHVTDASEETLAEDTCFNGKTVEWLSLPVR